MLPLPTIYYGAVINPTGLTCYDAWPNCLLAVSAAGNIEWMVADVADSMVQETMSQKGCLDGGITILKPGEFIVPGFIDTHTVSYRFLGFQLKCLIRYIMDFLACSTGSEFGDVSSACSKPLSLLITSCSGGQFQLLDWLEKCTFPMESKFSNVEFARRTYKSVVRRYIDCGVSLASCFFVTL